jgi:predicted N-acetyltransferase YhbS
MIDISAPTESDVPAIEHLLDEVFGRDRRRKTSYRYRVGVDPIPALSLVAYDGRRLVGTIRYWPVLIGDSDFPALLLGPLGVAPDRRGEGIGVTLVTTSLGTAVELGHRAAVLVGDQPYYERFAFQPARNFAITMADEPERLMARELVPGALRTVHGAVRRWACVGASRIAA